MPNSFPASYCATFSFTSLLKLNSPVSIMAFSAFVMAVAVLNSSLISFCPLFVNTLKSILASTFELMLVFTRSFVSLVVSLFSLVRSSELSLSAISMLPLPRVARFLDSV